MLWAGDVALPFSRGYVSLALRNHATMKYWPGSAASDALRQRRLRRARRHGRARVQRARLADATFRGLSGCTMGGAECQWEGDVIPAFPEDSGRVMCAQTTCTYDGEGRNVGLSRPQRRTRRRRPAALHFSGVTKGGARRARVALAATYPWFEWNMMFPPPTQMDAALRVNGGAWHDRFVTAVEANAFTDFNPSLGGAGASAGLLNQMIDSISRSCATATTCSSCSRGHVDRHVPRAGHGGGSDARRSLRRRHDECRTSMDGWLAARSSLAGCSPSGSGRPGRRARRARRAAAGTTGAPARRAPPARAGAARGRRPTRTAVTPVGRRRRRSG